MLSLWSSLKNSAFFKPLSNYFALFLEILAFIKQCLGRKKIVIISENGISSLPISSKLQFAAAFSTLSLMLWLSYSTGKYFAYESVISKKDKEIWSTNVTNESLQYQVSDLHKNLVELNNYFENVRSLDQLSKKNIFEQESENNQLARLKREYSSEEYQTGAKRIMMNIREKVLERISSLEAVIEMTGIKLEDYAKRNGSLKKTLEESSFSNQGGPYIPAESSFELSDLGDMRFQEDVSYLMQLEKTIHSMPLSSPVNRYYISSRFGKRIDPMKGAMAFHGGIDLVARYKSKVRSTAPGVVTYARPYGAYGLLVEIDHGSGVATRYGHLNRIFVKEGSKVGRGRVIGLQGNSGRSTGDHLHYEVRFGNKARNPEKFLKAGKYVF